MSSSMQAAGRRAGGCGGCGLVVVLVGLGLILASMPLLVWNEGRAVSTYRTLIEGARIVQTIRSDAVDPARDGQLVHLVGQAVTAETLQDAELGVSAPAIKLRRTVEMYQWKETKHNSSGNTNPANTTYNYAAVWSESLINSRHFYYPTVHRNPDAMPYTSQIWTAQTVSLGAYTLSASLVDQIDDFQPLSVETMPTGVDGQIQIVEGGFYLGARPASPQIGDVRIHYAQVTPATVSVIAQAAGSTFEPYRGKAGDTINLLALGEHSAAEMIATAQQENVFGTWLLRVMGAFMLLLGFQALNAPMAGLLRRVPLVGQWLQQGVGCAAAGVAALIALPLAAAISLAAWVFFRLT